MTMRILARWNTSLARCSQPGITKPKLATGNWLLATPMGYAGSVVAVVLASPVAEAARHLLDIVNISLVYLIVVVAVATLWGLWPALVASLLAATALDLLFVPPFGKLTVAKPGDWLTLLFFLVIAILTGRLAAGARARAEEAHRRERATAALYDLSTALIAEGDLAVILPGIVRRVAETFALDACHILLPGEDHRLHVWRPSVPGTMRRGAGRRRSCSRFCGMDAPPPFTSPPVHARPGGVT